MHAAAFALLAVELAVVVAIATLFSAFTTPMLATLFAGGVWIVGNLTRNLRDLGAESEIAFVRQLAKLLYGALPDLASFNLSLEAAHGLPIAASDVWLPVLYGDRLRDDRARAAPSSSSSVATSNRRAPLSDGMSDSRRAFRRRCSRARRSCSGSSSDPSSTS